MAPGAGGRLASGRRGIGRLLGFAGVVVLSAGPSPLFIDWPSVRAASRVLVWNKHTVVQACNDMFIQSADFDAWIDGCLVCQLCRATLVAGPLRSPTADDAQRLKAPWSDVMIDVQGPYTRAEGCDQYVLAYLCMSLRVPKVAALKALQPDSLLGPSCRFVRYPRARDSGSDMVRPRGGNVQHGETGVPLAVRPQMHHTHTAKAEWLSL